MNETTPEGHISWVFWTTEEPDPGTIPSFNELCAEFNQGNENFDLCGALVLRTGTAAYAVFLAVTSITILRYLKPEKEYMQPTTPLQKFRAHKLSWLTLIFTLMFEHYQLATWLVLFYDNALVKIYVFSAYALATPSSFIYYYRTERYHSNPIFLVGHVLYASMLTIVHYMVFVSLLDQATEADGLFGMDLRFLMSGLATVVTAAHTALCCINIFIPRGLQGSYNKLSNLDDDDLDDDGKEVDECKITYDQDSFPAQLMLWFVSPVIWRHRKQTFTQKDIGALPDRFDPCSFSGKLWTEYNLHPNMQRHLRLLWALFWATLTPVVQCFGLMLSVEIFTLAPPLMLGTIITFVEDGGTHLADPQFLTFGEAITNGFIICGFLINLLSGRTLLSTYAQLIKKNAILNAFTTLQYCIGEKILKMESLKHNAEFSSGKIINLISQDVKKTTTMLSFIPGYIIIPLKFCAIAYIMCHVIGKAVYIAFPISFTLYILQIFIIRFTVKYRKERLGVLDERNTQVKNMFNVIRLLKIYNLTDVYRKRLNDIRDRDIKVGIKLAICGSLTQVIGGCYSMVFLVTLFIVYWYMYGEIMTTGTVFMSLGLIMSLKKNLANLSGQLTSAGKSYVSLDRLVQYFDLPEVTGLPGTKKNIEYYTKFKDDTLVITNASFQHNATGEVVLRNINLSVPRGKLTVILGPTACGKSSLLSTMLGEMDKVTGNVLWLDPANSVGLCAQVPWIFNATVRKNVIMDAPFDDLRYSRCVKACCLIDDIETFHAGDMSEIGPKGTTLSGGQKQRVSLARVLYSKTQTVLLDDPFSALDNTVAKKVFLGAVKRHLLATGRTVVMVTSAQGYAQLADHVVLMNEGEIEAQGTVQYLTDKGYKFENKFGGRQRIPRQARRVGTNSDTDPSSTAEGNNRRGRGRRGRGGEREERKEGEEGKEGRGRGRGGRGRGASENPGEEGGEKEGDRGGRRGHGGRGRGNREKNEDGTERERPQRDGDDTADGETKGRGRGRGRGGRGRGRKEAGEERPEVEEEKEEQKEDFIIDENGEKREKTFAEKLAGTGKAASRRNRRRRKRRKGGDPNVEGEGDTPAVAARGGGRGRGGGGRRRGKNNDYQKDESGKWVIKSGDEAAGKLIKEEKATVGSVGSTIYMRYIRDFGLPLLCVALVTLVTNMTIQTCSVLWLTMWTSTNRDTYPNGTYANVTSHLSNLFPNKTNQELYNQGILFQSVYNKSNHQNVHSNVLHGVYELHKNATHNNHSSILSPLIAEDEETGYDATYIFFTSRPTQFYIGVYVCLVLSAISVNVINRVYVKLMSFRLSKKLFMRLLDTQFRATSRYFDETLVGRVVNRFTMDTNNAEESGIRSILALIMGILANVKFVGMQLFVSWFVVLFYFPAFYVVFTMQNMQLQTSRQNRRLTAMLRTPVLESVNNLMEGVASIRAFGIEKFKLADYQNAIKKNTAARLWGIYFGSWISLYISLIGVFFVGFSSLMSIMACLAGYVHPALMGIALLYTFQVTRQVSGLTRRYASLEQNFSAVERLYQLEDDTPAEYDVPTAIPRPNWPQYGFIKIKNLTCRYADHLDDVLHGVTFDICAGHKIGICGRTGSGKSSLGLALLRMLPHREGSITIDGINISEVSLAKLRDSITIIPQEPILFEGTVRQNLDITGNKTDEQLWTALEIALIKDAISDMSDGLDSKIVDEGENLSKGQRQLLCFARAFLRNTRIFILDESSASLDSETDTRMQRIIADRFKQCTVITVAHRVNTIVDSDMILGMEDGKIVEYDTPQHLMSSEKSMFRKLVNKSLS